MLDSQRLAVKKLLADGGATFDAISKQPGELRSLIENTQSVFSTTAARDTEIREIFQALPTFLDESKLTLERLDEFSGDTNALVTQLRPVARQLSGTFVALKRLSPEAKRFFNGLGPVIQRAEPGFSSLRVVLNDQLPPFLGRLDPFFDQLIPIVDTIDRYKKEVTAFLANTSSAINAASVPPATASFKYLRATGPLGPAVLGSPPSPYKTSRLNAYVRPGGYTKLAQGLDSLFTQNCTSGLTATLQQGDFTSDLWDRTQFYAMGGPGSPTPTTSPRRRADSRARSPRLAGPLTRIPISRMSTRSHDRG